MDFMIMVTPSCVRGRFNDLLEELSKDVTLMVTVYYRSTIHVIIRKEQKTHRAESRRNRHEQVVLSQWSCADSA